MQINASTILTFWGIPSAVTGFYFRGLKRNITKRDAQRDAKREELDNARKKNEVLLIKNRECSHCTWRNNSLRHKRREMQRRDDCCTSIRAKGKA